MKMNLNSLWETVHWKYLLASERFFFFFCNATTLRIWLTFYLGVILFKSTFAIKHKIEILKKNFKRKKLFLIPLPRNKLLCWYKYFPPVFPSWSISCREDWANAVISSHAVLKTCSEKICQALFQQRTGFSGKPWRIFRILITDENNNNL